MKRVWIGVAVAALAGYVSPTKGQELERPALLLAPPVFVAEQESADQLPVLSDGGIDEAPAPPAPYVDGAPLQTSPACGMGSGAPYSCAPCPTCANAKQKC